MSALLLAYATSLMLSSTSGPIDRVAMQKSWSIVVPHEHEYHKSRAYLASDPFFPTHTTVSRLVSTSRVSRRPCGWKAWNTVVTVATGGIVNPVTTRVVREAASVGGKLAGLLTGSVVAAITSPMVNDAIAVLRTSLKAVEDIGAETRNGVSNSAAEAKRGARNLGDAAEAIGGYVHDKTLGTVNSYSHTLDEMREGKIVDGLWHAGTDQWKIEDDAASKAAMKSSILRTVGQVTASVYGGPGGTAAYAAWLTYHQSGGDVDAALKVGIISGATAWAMQTTGKLPSTDSSGHILLSEAAKKVVIAGAVSGAAMAAAGGDENDVRDAFVKGGSMIVIQEGYRDYTQHPLDDESLKSSTGHPYCISATVDCQEPPVGAAVYDENGKFKGWDQAKLDPLAPHVGMGFPDTPISPSDVTLSSEGSAFMQGVSKIPGMNAMAVFHDQWSMNWSFPTGVLQGSIYPAIVLTYNGTTAPLLEDIRVSAVKRARRSNETSDRQIVHVVRDDVPSKAPVVEDHVEQSFACAGDHDTRSIVLEVDPSHESFSCRVLYRAKDMRTVPWRATYQAKYCAAKARGLADVQVRAGYRCLVAYPTDRLPPNDQEVSLSEHHGR